MVRVRIDSGNYIELDDAQIKGILKELFPAGDPLFQDITWEEQNLYNRKNQDYAAGGNDADPNGNFHRAAKIFSLYPGLSLADPRVYAMVQMMKQIDQVFWSLSRGFEGTVEGLEARLGDISVYAKIIMVLNRRVKSPEKETDKYLKDRALSLEDMLSRGDAMLENLTKAVLELRKLKDEVSNERRQE